MGSANCGSDENEDATKLISDQQENVPRVIDDVSTQDQAWIKVMKLFRITINRAVLFILLKKFSKQKFVRYKLYLFPF